MEIFGELVWRSPASATRPALSGRRERDPLLREFGSVLGAAWPADSFTYHWFGQGTAALGTGAVGMVAAGVISVAVAG